MVLKNKILLGMLEPEMFRTTGWGMSSGSDD